MPIQARHVATLTVVALIALGTSLLVARGLDDDAAPPPPPPPSEVETAVFGFG